MTAGTSAMPSSSSQHPHPTTTWDTIQDVFYRRQPLYSSLPWPVQDLSDYLVAVGKGGGGPVALLRDERKVVEFSVAYGRDDEQVKTTGLGGGGKPKIMVYTAAGGLVATFNWDLPPPVHMSWTPDNDRLLVLGEDGTYRLYSLAAAAFASSSSSSSSPSGGVGAAYSQHTLGGVADVAEVGIVDARSCGDAGLVVLTGGLEFVFVRGWEGARGTAMAMAGLTELPTSWNVLSPEQSQTGHVEVLIATRTTVLTLSEIDRVDQHVDLSSPSGGVGGNAAITHLCPSPNGRLIALLNDRARLRVLTADFGRQLSEVDVTPLAPESGAAAVSAMEWCGNDALAVAWPGGQVSVVGPQGEALTFSYPPTAHLVGEMDGLRIQSSMSCDFVQKVPDASLAVFRPGSSEPAAILFDAMEQFERASPRADESLRSIRPELAEAVDKCVDAAGMEPEPYWQKRLLRAAMFGRSFLDFYNPSDLVEMARTLKVLNAVRAYEVGMPLTCAQYTAMSPERLVTRLLSRNLHLLALRISTHLNLRPDPVMRHWACAKIAAHGRVGDSALASQPMTDDELRKMIVRKFEKEGSKGANYAEIAKAAWQLGRTKLATKLLDHERQAAEQVPLLLSMKEDRLALVKAIDSGDTDLVYHVLLHLRSRLSPGDLFSLVDDGTPQMAPAARLLQLYARDADRELLRDFYYQDDRRLDNACLELQEAGETAKVQERLKHLKNAASSFAEDKERAFEARITDDSHRLLSLQREIEDETDGKYPLLGLSVNDTLSQLLLVGLTKRAERLRGEFKVPDKRWWWIKLKVLAEVKDWDGLDAFAKSKKSPIGYEPFVQHLVHIGERSRATAFVARCDPKSRVDLYLRCGDWGRAAQECKDRGDKTRLQELQRMAPDSLTRREVDEVISRETK